MIHCCEGMYTGFHLPPVSAAYDVLRRNCVSFSEGPDRTIFDLDARLGRSTVSTCGIGKGRDPEEMKATVHVVTTVYHGSVYVQSYVVITVSVCQCKPEL